MAIKSSDELNLSSSAGDLKLDVFSDILMEAKNVIYLKK